MRLTVLHKEVDKLPPFTGVDSFPVDFVGGKLDNTHDECMLTDRSDGPVIRKSEYQFNSIHYIYD